MESKLFDFGGVRSDEEEAITFSGSIKHSPPEVIKQRQQQLPVIYTSAADIYMFAIMIVEVLQLQSQKQHFYLTSKAENKSLLSLLRYFDTNRVWEGLTVNDILLRSKNEKEEGKERDLCALRFDAYRDAHFHPPINDDFVSLINSMLNPIIEARPSIHHVITHLEKIISNYNYPYNSDDVVDDSAPRRIFEVDYASWLSRNRAISRRTSTSKHIYAIDEVYSCLQKAIRRCNVEETIYWAMEFDISGRGQSAIDRLTVIASEDQSIAYAQTPIYLWDAWSAYVALNERAESGDVDALIEQRVIIVRMAEILAKMKTCRTTNNACCVSMGLVQQKIDRCAEILQSEGEEGKKREEIEKWYMGEPNDRYLRSFTAYAKKAHEEGGGEAEEEALFLLQRLYMEEDKRWATKLWDEMMTWRPRYEETGRAIRALRSLFESGIGEESGTRLRIFHALLLFTRERYFYDNNEEGKEGRLVDELPCSELSVNEILAMYYESENQSVLEGRWPSGVHDYCVDRHCKRGKGKGAEGDYHYGADTTNDFYEAAKEWGVDVSGWSKEEIAKSHGEGKVWSKNQKVGEGPSLISQFFDVGSSVENEVYRSPHSFCVYRQRAKEYYLRWEEEYGSLEAKSVRIMSTQRKLIASLQSSLL